MYLLIHGAYSRPHIFNYIVKELGLGNQVETITYNACDDFTGVITRLYEEVEGKEYKAIIGHSLGGPIGYRLMQKGLQSEKLISISSPFGGGEPPEWLFRSLMWLESYTFFPVPPGAKRLIDFVNNIGRDSPEFCKIAHGPVPEGQYFSIITNMGKVFMAEDNDGVVSVSTQKAHPGKPTARMIRCAHSDVMLHDKTVELLRKWL